MTKIFDDNARLEILKHYNECDFYVNDSIKARDITVKEITVKAARPFISMFHYSKTIPDSSKFVYAGFVNGEICGIVVYGMGAGSNQYKSVIPDIKKGEYCELTRLWCKHDMPKNTESKIISESLKLLPKEVKLVISFADESKGHNGTIYQATNWLYLGKNKGGKTMVGSDGIEKHPRLIGIYKLRHPELKLLSNKEIMELNEWEYKKSGAKHRYVYIRGDKKYKKEKLLFLKNRILPYPKFENIKENKSDIDILKKFKFFFKKGRG